eukprot:TRINITY_DN20061_c0_g1_i3.p1 TRINITY_DN20061_c0_g1~~TRINITY_DN20061_c0_g1_i3.p1  ORF type:complete len:204 (-),score=21.35 TRINITY_DN20061_c0_g1_i3:120-731(-)
MSMSCFVRVVSLHGKSAQHEIKLGDQAVRRGAPPLDAVTLKRYTREMAAAVEHIHDLRIVHRDIKPANFLLSAEGRVKMIDFGASAHFGEWTVDVGTVTFQDFTEEYIASPASDIWSFGLTLIAVHFRSMVCRDIVTRRYRLACLSAALPVFLHKHEPQDPLLVDLLRKMLGIQGPHLSLDTGTRISIKEVLDHPYLTDKSLN